MFVKKFFHVFNVGYKTFYFNVFYSHIDVFTTMEVVRTTPRLTAPETEIPGLGFGLGLSRFLSG